MKMLFLGCSLVMLFTFASAQESAGTQGAAFEHEKANTQSAPTALAAYTKWRNESLSNYAQKDLTPHYAVAVVAQRISDQTAQIEVLLAAEMQHYVITVRPVTFNRQASGEVTTTPVGKAVVIDQKAGRKFTNGSDATRVGETTTIVPVTKAAEALEITWEPKNDTKDDPSNKCLVRLGKEPAVVVNGYIAGEPVK